MTVLLVGLGAAVGAPARYLTDLAVQRRLGAGFPWGTWVVNVVACLVLGAVTRLAVAGHLGDGMLALVGTGFCGALSTYSTFSLDALRLTESGRAGTAILYVVASVGAGLAAVGAGWGLGSAIG